MNATRLFNLSRELHDLTTREFTHEESVSRHVKIMLNREFSLDKGKEEDAKELERLISHLNEAVKNYYRPRIEQLERAIKGEVEDK